jgi:hypothetical protein
MTVWFLRRYSAARQHDLEFTSVGIIQPHLRSGTCGRLVRGKRTEAELLDAYDFEQPEEHVDRIVETEIAVGEEHVSVISPAMRHLSSLFLMSECPVFDLIGRPAWLRDVVAHPLRAFHIANKTAPGALS